MVQDPPNPPWGERCLYPRLDSDGRLFYNPVLTHCSRTDPVDIAIGKARALPIVFVPGIMGSNLKMKGEAAEVWTLDGLTTIAMQQMFKNAGQRQKFLHPLRTEVDPGGKVPDRMVGVLRTPEHFRQRGWGEVAATSYHDTLIWLEETFHCQRGMGLEPDPHAVLNRVMRESIDGRQWGVHNGNQKPFEPLTEPECVAAESWNYPVYAFGYNWLDTNENAAKQLATRIGEIIAANNGDHGHCEQVIVVTHSMGGLVARRCAQLPGMSTRIAGVLHGVMPAVGAAVAYRRCKVGMWDEDLLSSLVIGRTGKEVTAVFSQAPGALELLPCRGYTPGWLEVRGVGSDQIFRPDLQMGNFDAAYLERSGWWGLIREDWLAPKDGVPTTWEDFIRAIKLAHGFHRRIKVSYHDNSWAFYGIGLPTFDRVVWTFEQGRPEEPRPVRSPPIQRIVETTHQQVDVRGYNTVYLPDLYTRAHPRDVYVSDSAPQFRMRLMAAQDPLGDEPVNLNQTGDGTVPVSSGSAPWPHVQQVFAVRGIQHESAYGDAMARQVTAYVIAKIAASASCSLGRPSTGAGR